MRPAHLLLAVAAVAAVGFGGAGLAAGVTWLRIDHVERELAAEFAELRAVDAFADQPVPESQELSSARAQLARLLEEIEPDGRRYLPFGTPQMLQTSSREELGRALEQRATWYDALDGLPRVLWSVPDEPPTRDLRERRPSDSLAALRSAINHVCAMAWYLAGDPERAHQAAHWIARGLALLRATDSGSNMDLHTRVALEGVLLDRARLCSDIAGFDRECLQREVRVELERFDESGRLARALRDDLRVLELQFEVVRGRPADAERLRAQHHTLRKLRTWCELLPTDLQARLPELAARLEDVSLPDTTRVDYFVFASWQIREERVAEFLAGT